MAARPRKPPSLKPADQELWLLACAVLTLAAGCRACPGLADCDRWRGARLAGDNLVASRRTAAALAAEFSRRGRLSRCFPHLSPVFRQGSGHRTAHPLSRPQAAGDAAGCATAWPSSSCAISCSSPTSSTRRGSMSPASPWPLWLPSPLRWPAWRHAGLVRRRESAAVRAHAGAGRAFHARAVPALSARARPALGNADRMPTAA